MSILIVDDSDKQRLILEFYLKKGGLKKVISVASAKDAFHALHINSPDAFIDIDLILMDIMMPEVSGIEACQVIKNTQHLCDIPIIMVTGASDVESLKAAFIAGAADYIIKPVKEVELISRVRSLLKLKQEMDARKKRERELIEVTQLLKENVEQANRMTLEAEIASAELKQIFNIAPSGMCLIDKDYNVIRINNTYTQLFGVQSKSVIGRKCYGICGEDICHTRNCPMLKIVEGVHYSGYDVEKKTKKGINIPCLLTASPFKNPDGDIIGIVVNLMDIRDRKKAETEKLHREKLQGIIELAGAVCHELHQPMMAISGYTELLLMDISPFSGQGEKIRHIQEQIGRMVDITRKIMRITRYETTEYVNGIKILDIEQSSKD